MNLLILGAGGHSKSCISCAESAGFIIEGLIDNQAEPESRVSGYPILGGDEILSVSFLKHKYVFLGIGQIKSSEIRKKLFSVIKSLGGEFATIISSYALRDRNSEIGEGSILMHRSVVNSHANVGINSIVNTGAIVEHDAVIGNFVHISTGAIVNGECKIGDDCFIGSGAVLKQGVYIAPGTVIGAGSVVIDNINIPGVYAGIPAKKLK